MLSRFAQLRLTDRVFARCAEIDVDEAPELVVRTVLNIVKVPETDR